MGRRGMALIAAALALTGGIAQLVGVTVGVFALIRRLMLMGPRAQVSETIAAGLPVMVVLLMFGVSAVGLAAWSMKKLREPA